MHHEARGYKTVFTDEECTWLHSRSDDYGINKSYTYLIIDDECLRYHIKIGL